MIPGVWHVRDAILRLQPTPLYALLRFPLLPWILAHFLFLFFFTSALNMGFFPVTCLEPFCHCVGHICRRISPRRGGLSLARLEDIDTTHFALTFWSHACMEFLVSSSTALLFLWQVQGRVG
jgi:hypothetical protein